MGIESDASIRFKLEKQIEQTEAELHELDRQLDKLERGLPSRRSPNNRTTVVTLLTETSATPVNILAAFDQIIVQDNQILKHHANPNATMQS